MIRVRQGDLASTPAEAILRPVSAEGSAVTPVGRRLEVAAGGTVAERLRGLGELPVGGAVITPAGNLSAAFVIHVVTQSAIEATSPPVLQKAIVNGLRRATEWGVESLAMPPVGLGPGTMDPEDAARILFDALRQHLRDGADPRELVVVVENDFEEELYRRLVATVERLDGEP